MRFAEVKVERTDGSEKETLRSQSEKPASLRYQSGKGKPMGRSIGSHWLSVATTSTVYSPAPGGGPRFAVVNWAGS